MPDVDDLIDLCPKCGKEVFIYYPTMSVQKFKCVEPTCEWVGNEPEIGKRKDHE